MKILIVKLSSMGDVICTLPAVTDAKREIAGIEFDWVVEEGFAEIPKWHPAIGSVIKIGLRRWRKNLFNSTTIQEVSAFLKQLRTERYDYILDVQGLLKSAIISRIACGASYGFNARNAREPIAACFYHHRLNVSKKLHAVERSRLLFANALNYNITMGTPDYGIMKEKFGLPSNNLNEQYLVFAHGSSRHNKCWQEERWGELARLAKTAGFKVKLPWGNALELDSANRIATISDNIEVLPKITLTEIGAILLRASGVVAVDTGLSHFTAALGVPAVSLYGPTDPKLAGTYGKNQVQMTNMSELTAEEVWQKLKNFATIQHNLIFRSNELRSGWSSFPSPTVC